MKYAEVAVNSPVAQRQSFCYSIPTHLTIDTGQAVWVPFGPRLLQGIVIRISDVPSFENTREIAGVISSVSILSAMQLELALWMSQYYLAPIFDCISLFLPPGFERKLVTFLQILPESQNTIELSTVQKQVLDLFEGRERIRLKDVERKIGKIKATRIIRDLIYQKILFRVEELAESRLKPKLVPFLKPNFELSTMVDIVTRLKKRKASKQVKVIEYLANHDELQQLSEVKRNTGCELATIRAMVKGGLVSMLEIAVRRDPLVHYHIITRPPPVLTVSQEIVWKTIEKELDNPGPGVSSRIFLLEGVTGSGKTEIYLRTLAKLIAQGKKGICLVPEIALTTQTIERFASRFPGRVAVFHSGLSSGEQYDEWHRISKGDCDVVIGPRSALFMPLNNLGIVVIDEEHEWTYKQADKSPRYHARSVAIKMAELAGNLVILGSATPDVESYYNAVQGNYQLISLRERITVRGLTPLPAVAIVDLRDELKAGNRSIFSRSLSLALRETLDRGEQAILFLNRRGTANFARCLSCGMVIKCPRCLVALTYHSEGNQLVCHHCGYRCFIPEICPQCFKPRIKLFGIGTQKVEEETQKMFPRARIVRWDSDVASRKGIHELIFEKLVKHEADILIGTQMIAKGLDLPQVTLAGVLNADTGLNLPDFRAGERIFQLTCQIAGRAGRGLAAGRVIIQTYSPDYYAIQAAAKHDYQEFYEKEMEFRRTLAYPPFNQLANLLISHTNNQACQREAEKIYEIIALDKDRKGIPNLRIIGPIPAFIPRIRGHYRWQIVLCGHGLSRFLNEITFPKGLVIDIDPATMI